MTQDPAIGVVAGSGMNLRALLSVVEHEYRFRDFAGLPAPGVPGHAGRFLAGRAGGVRIILQEGRLHCYEGHTPETAGRPAEVLRELGARAVVFTSAAGGLRTGMAVGDLLSASAVRCWPFHAWTNDEDILHPTLLLDGVDHTGPYIWMHGPCYETRAEVHALQALGAAAVGMSTAPELERCRRLQLPAGVVSCITNNCCDPVELMHDHVVRAAQAASARLVEVIRANLPSIVARVSTGSG